MTRQSAYICAVLLIIWGFFVSAPLFAQSTELISFNLKDQFDREYTEKSFPGKILIMIEGDREGSKYCTRWKEAISDVLKKEQASDNIQFVSVADLRGVPSFLQGYVKGKFSKNKDKWSLMDWDGIFARSYNFVLKSSNILVFNLQKQLVYQADVCELCPEKLGKITDAVKRMNIDHLK